MDYEQLESITDTLEVQLATKLEEAGYKDHEDMDGNDFSILLAFFKEKLEDQVECAKVKLLTEGYKDLPIEQRLHMFSSALAMTLNELAESTNATEAEYETKGKIGELKTKFIKD